MAPRPRIPETHEGIQDEITVEQYDRMLRRLRDRGWMETRSLLASGVVHGEALEVGPGPGYLGLEWLKHTEGTHLTGVEISPAMIALAERNAGEYGLRDRVRYVLGDAQQMPFEDHRFDAVFTNGSLHEWEDPGRVLAEIHRVLRRGGRFFVSDLRRDMLAPLRWLMWWTTRPREIRPGLLTSIDAAYTPSELEEIVSCTPLSGARVRSNPIGVEIVGQSG